MQRYLGGHLICQQHQEPLNLVCLDDKCPNKGAICAYCEYRTHKHPVKALTYLFHQINRDMKAYQQSLSLMAQLDQSFGQIQTQVRKVENVNDRKIVEETLRNYYNHNVATIFKRSRLVAQFQNIKHKTIKDVNSFINKYNFIDKQQNPQSYTNYEFDVRGKLEELKSSLKEVKQCVKNHEPIQKVLVLFSIEQERRIKYTFNAEKSHKDMIITDKVKVQLKQGYSYRIALIDPVIRKESSKLKKATCTFRVPKVVAMVGLGVVYKSKVETSSYVFSAYSQHGCYFITNSGYTYNESNSGFNSQIKNWSFTSNDVIKVVLFPREKKITFEKQGKDSFQMPFEDKSDLQLNFAVLLCQKDDCAEIIQN